MTNITPDDRYQAQQAAIRHGAFDVAPAAEMAPEIGEPGGRDDDYRERCECGSDRFEIYYDPIVQGRSILCARCGSAFLL